MDTRVSGDLSTVSQPTAPPFWVLLGRLRWLRPVAVAVVVWEAASALLLASGANLAQVKLPFLHRIAVTAVGQSSTLAEAVWVTARGAAAGLAFGTVLGVAVAVLVVQARWIEHAVYPYVIAGQMIPTIALAPILMTALKNPTAARIAIATYITFFAVSLGTMKGLKSVRQDEYDLLRSFDASRAHRFIKLKVPTAAPYFFTGLKVAAPLSVVGQIAVELTGATSGLGYLLLITQYYGPQFANVFWASMVITLALGYVFFLVAVLAERHLAGWQHEFR